MKKVWAIFLTLALLCGAWAVPVNAADKKEFRYYDDFKTQYCEGKDPLALGWEEFFYDELYYHQTDGQTDWALICAEFGQRAEVEMYRMLFGRAIAANDCAFPFEFLYGVYDVAQGRFFDLKELGDASAYPDLQEVFDRFGVGQRVGAPQYGEHLQYLPAFLRSETLGYGESAVKAYDELYYHESGGAVDWVLVKGESWFTLPYGGTYRVVGGKVFRSTGIPLPFGCGYGVYHVAKHTFVELGSALQWFPGLEEAVARLDIGERIGDVNQNGALDIGDATELQRCLAEFREYPGDDGVEADGYQTDGAVSVQYLSDLNGDGVRNICDVTEAQRQLAQQ